MCRHFFRVGTYSSPAFFHISLIPNRWHQDPNINEMDLIQQIPAIQMCISPDSNDSDKQQRQITLNQLYSFRSIINDSSVNVKRFKTEYVELFGLPKKVLIVQ